MFTTKYEQSRQALYPKAQDPNFLGFDRDKDRWKVDASGIKLYASGISVDLDKNTDSVSVWSASGTAPLPVYIDGQIPIAVSVDIESDSIKVFSSSGTPEIETWINNQPITVTCVDPVDSKPLKRNFSYNDHDDISEMKIALASTPSGAPCKIATFNYNSNQDVDYIVESLGTW